MSPQNKLSELSSGVFSPLPDLGFLFLQNNPLGHLPQGVLRPLDLLSHLDLSGCQLKVIPDYLPWALR